MLRLLEKACGTRTAILVFLVLHVSSPISAEQAFRAPPPLAEIVGTADAIIIGRISSVDNVKFKLHVTEVISARIPFNQTSLHVRRSPRPPTDLRWAPYKQGQDILVFLNRNTEARQWFWSFASLPNDSEWPVNKELVYFFDRFIDSLPINSNKIDGYQFFAQRLPRSTVISALKRYKTCFSWQNTLSDDLLSPNMICGDDILKRYCIESVMHRHLARETLKILNTSVPSVCNSNESDL